MGGVLQGRLWPRDDAERRKALDAGHDLQQVLTTRDLVTTDNVYFAATGVTDGELVGGVATEGFSHPVKIGIGGEVREMGAGERASVRLADDPADIPAPPAGDEHVLVGQGRAERRGTVEPRRAASRPGCAWARRAGCRARRCSTTATSYPACASPSTPT